MRNLSVLAVALEIVEERLRRPLNVTELATACYSSCSGLQRLFGYAFGCSVSEYITKRRISCAAQELVLSERAIIDIAFDYQYGSPEAFSRAFKRCWGISPVEFRKTRRFTELLPKFMLETTIGGIGMTKRKPIDLSRLYDELKRLAGCYVLSIDICDFGAINENYNYAAGDFLLAETFARLEMELDENMLLFRIGGDEFAVVTNYISLSDAEALAQRIVAHNDEVVKYNGHELPLSLRIGISRWKDEVLNYRSVLNAMYDSIEQARISSENIAVYKE